MKRLRYKCEHCRYETRLKNNFKRHLTAKIPCYLKHADMDHQKYTMTVERLKYGSDAAKLGYLTIDTKYKCIYCSNLYATVSNMSKHLKKNCPKIRERYLTDIKNQQQEKKVDKSYEALAKKVEQLEREQERTKQQLEAIDRTKISNNFIVNIIISGQCKFEFRALGKEDLSELDNEVMTNIVRRITNSVNFLNNKLLDASVENWNHFRINDDKYIFLTDNGWKVEDYNNFVDICWALRSDQLFQHCKKLIKDGNHDNPDALSRFLNSSETDGTYERFKQLSNNFLHSNLYKKSLEMETYMNNNIEKLKLALGSEKSYVEYNFDMKMNTNKYVAAISKIKKVEYMFSFVDEFTINVSDMRADPSFDIEFTLDGKLDNLAIQNNEREVEWLDKKLFITMFKKICENFEYKHQLLILFIAIHFIDEINEDNIINTINEKLTTIGFSPTSLV